MTFSRKIFIAVFISTFMIGTILIWSAHWYVASSANEDFVSRYTVFSKILGDTLSRLDSNTETLMLNAAKVVAEKDAQKGLLSTNELRLLQSELGVTHLFVIDKRGRFVRSTNDAPEGIPNLFSFSESYRSLLTGDSLIEATPIIKPNPEPRPFKFLSIPNKNRTRIIEVGIRVEFIANTLVEAIASDQNVTEMTLYAPDGTPFGTFSRQNVIFQSEKKKLPSPFNTKIESDEAIRFFTKVTSSHPRCGQCDVAGSSVGGEYYYVLESTVSKRELKAVLAKASYLFLLIGLGNALLSWAVAYFLSRRLVKNIESAVERVRTIKNRGTLDGRINLKSGDELSFLTGEFDRLLDSLDESQKKLIEAEKVQSKVELARVVAHNIRSPIIAIEMMLPGLITVPDRVMKVLKNSVSEIKQLSEKLKSHTGASNLQEQMESQAEVVSVSNFISEIVQQKQIEYSELDRVHISFQMLPDDQNLHANINTLELRAVISNLINNAVESLGSTGGDVKIQLSGNADSCEILVTDNGIGIKPEHLQIIGRKHFSSKQESRGLGLYHAFRSVEIWGGRIILNSRVGEGTSATIRLPRMMPAVPNVGQSKISMREA
jgi:signal transduction histidine kinase